MPEISHAEFEQRLARLTPRGAPAVLREQILSRLEQEYAARAPALTTRMDRVANLAIAASVALAIVAWVVNIRFQERRFASLLGPTPAERQAERAIQLMRPAAGNANLDSLQDQLRVALERAHRRQGRMAVQAFPSLTTVEIDSIARARDETKKHSEVPGQPRRDTSYYRRGNQLESIRSA